MCTCAASLLLDFTQAALETVCCSAQLFDATALCYSQVCAPLEMQMWHFGSLALLVSTSASNYNYNLDANRLEGCAVRCKSVVSKQSSQLFPAPVKGGIWSLTFDQACAFARFDARICH